jgi:CheY-like chemotaxis protein
MNASPTRARVRADRTQLEQVVLNLSINARDAMPAGGRLKITIGPVTIARDSQVGGETIPKGAYALISVSDTGIGMDEETQARAFEPFFTTKEAGRGTGLGLATVYGIVKQSGGVIALTSRPGSGTTVSIYLPLVEAETEAPVFEVPSAQPDLLGGHETILVVEDQPDVRELVRDMLAAGGYAVLDAERPSSAEEICRVHEGRIDLLLTDVVMPDMSGHELAGRVAVLRPETKVLFMSGYPDHPITASGIVSDAPLVSKPFTRQLLLTRVRQVLDA